MLATHQLLRGRVGGQMARHKGALRCLCDKPKTIPEATKATETTGSKATETAGPKAKPKKSKLFGWTSKLVGAGAMAIGAYYSADYALHPRPKSEVIKDLLLKTSSLKDRKERVVVLGTGWGAVATMRNLDPFKYEVVCVSPRNYFVLTPLLPSVTVGTVEPRTIVESIRSICPHIKFVEAECTAVDHKKKTIQVIPTDAKFISSSRAVMDSTRTRPGFEMAYDKLVVAVGAENNTFDTPGVREHAHFLKEIVDARRIRAAVIDAFESACNPAQSDTERRRLLNFVVVGGGPTGLEFAAELAGLVHLDLHPAFPELRSQVRIQLVEAMENVLSMFDKQISDYTAQNFRKEQIDVLSNTFVKEVKEREIIVQRKGSKTLQAVPCSLVVWATGIKCRPFVNKLREAIGLKVQNNFRGLVTDGFLEVKGAPGIYALGDCATIAPRRLTVDVEMMFAEADLDSDGGISLSEFRAWTQKRVDEYPQLQFLANTDELAERFKKYAGRGWRGDPKLKLKAFKQVCEEADRTLRTLPATAQVASQQGKYLGQRMSCMPTAYEEASSLNSVKKRWLGFVGAANLERPFRYVHMGSMTSVGGEAVTDLARTRSKKSIADLLNINAMTGEALEALLLWRSFYLSEQCSTRIKLLLLFDWVKATVFGRDVSRY